MKKFARWSLAFAAVMSFSASALAIPPCIYKVIQSNGLRKVDTGKLVCALSEQSGDLFYDSCDYVCKWVLPSLYGSSIAANFYAREGVTWDSFDCETSALFPVDAPITLNPHIASFGFNTRLQKVSMCSFSGMIDAESKTVKGVAVLGTPLSPPVTMSWVVEAC